MVRKSLCDRVVQVRRVNPRIIGVDFVVGTKVIQVFSVYAPQQGRSMEEKMEFYDQLTDEVKGKENCVMLGDFNGHVGEVKGCMKDVGLERGTEKVRCC